MTGGEGYAQLAFNRVIHRDRANLPLRAVVSTKSPAYSAQQS